jgi:hypothetical protein
MSSEAEIHIPAVVHALKRIGADYRIIAAQSEEVNDLVLWFERVFPFSYSQVDWTKIPSHECVPWNDVEELLLGLQGLTSDLSSATRVVVLFGNALYPSLEVRLSDMNRVAREIFEQFETSQDTWIICREENWCIEMHHEGTLCRGKGRPDFVFLGLTEKT